MMSAGRRNRGVRSRRFFMSEAKCQALPLACQALQADSSFEILIEKTRMILGRVAGLWRRKGSR